MKKKNQECKIISTLTLGILLLVIIGACSKNNNLIDYKKQPKFVAVGCGISGKNRDNNIATYSNDGIKWEKAKLPYEVYWRDVCYGNGKFVAVATDARAAYSNDGIKWEETKMPAESSWNNVCYGNERFLTIAYYYVAAYSEDGINWKETSMSWGNWGSVCYGNGKFVAIDTDSDLAAYSEDGINWFKTALPDEVLWLSVCYSEE